MENESILLNSNDFPKNLISISHQRKLENVLPDFESLHEKIESEFNEKKSEFEKCVFLNTPNELKEYIISKISDKKRTKFNKKYSDEIIKELSNKITTLHELAIKLNKIEMLFPPEEEESLDYWRFTIYKAIMKK
ncbi:MAG: hypothetical protein DI598_01640 [Pseudopedobacter saltans]|uniref:Uncharacterized protein n=1 Tax=Pseudopedobacter saltans TaxID=151895 RepID=A0A2W5H223_9SPHI|nr:MAG: hypothetical protein DI598_01640 [Pseudopedobacter saltans]